MVQWESGRTEGNFAGFPTPQGVCLMWLYVKAVHPMSLDFEKGHIHLCRILPVAGVRGGLGDGGRTRHERAEPSEVAAAPPTHTAPTTRYGRAWQDSPARRLQKGASKSRQAKPPQQPQAHQNANTGRRRPPAPTTPTPAPAFGCRGFLRRLWAGGHLRKNIVTPCRRIRTHTDA